MKQLYCLFLALCTTAQAQNVAELIKVSTVTSSGGARVFNGASDNLNIRAELIIQPDKTQILSLAAQHFGIQDQNRAPWLVRLQPLVETSGDLAKAYIKLDLNQPRSVLNQNQEYRDFLNRKQSFFKEINDIARSGFFPIMLAELNQTLGPPADGDDRPDVEREFLAITDSLATALQEIGGDLEKQLNGLVSLEIKAYHISQGNDRILVGPLPYVTIQDCVPVGLRPFQLLPSEGAQQAFDMARQLAPVANDLLSGEFKKQVELQIQKLKVVGREIESSLKTDLLDKILEDLEKLGQQGQQTSGISALIGQIKQLTDQVKAFKAALRASDSDATVLLTNAISILHNLQETGRDWIENLPQQLKAIRAGLQQVGQAALGTVQADLHSYLTKLEKALITDKGLFSDYFQNLLKVGQAYQSMSRIQDAAANLNAKVKALPLSGLIDASLDLEDFCHARETGDRVVIEARLLDKEGREIVRAPNHNFTLRWFQWHIKTTGFLAFANPGNEGDVTTKEDFQAVPAIAWYFKKDLKNHDAYNDLWSPGIGVTAMALNFNDTDNLELGLGLSGSILNGLLHASYGRNLQTETNYFSVGINPLVFKKLFDK